MNRTKTGTVTYSSNNSGGGWWLRDSDWFDLEAAGWIVEWVKGDQYRQMYFSGEETSDRWLGALATRASKSDISMRDAIYEFENVTGQNASELGCYSCCGPPHSFEIEYEDGSSDYWYTSAPLYGSGYNDW